MSAKTCKHKIKHLKGYLLHLVQPVSTLGIKYVLDGPWEGPKDVPVIITLCLLPASLLKVLNECTLIQISFVLQSNLIF